MKHILHTLLILACALRIRAATESADEKQTLAGSAVVAASDFSLVRDASVTSGATLKKLFLDQCAAVPGFFANTPNGSFSIAKTTGLQAALDAKQATITSGNSVSIQETMQTRRTLGPSLGAADFHSRPVPVFDAGSDVGVHNMLRVPAFHSKRLVLVGTSTVAGGGATTYANSWPGKLTTAMEARGWTVFNRGWSGQTIASVANQFHSSVLNLRPDAVLLQFGFTNEGLYTAPNQAAREVVFTTAREGLEKIIQACHAYNVRVVVGTPLVTTTSDSTTLTFHQRWREWLEERTDLEVIAITDSVSDNDAVFLSGLYADSLHCNDAGHQVLYDGTPDSIFEVINPSPRRTPRTGYSTLTNGTSAGFRYVPDKAIKSFSVSVWQRGAATNSRNPMGFHSTGPAGDTNRMRFNSPGVSLAIYTDFEIFSTVNPDGNTWHHFAVTYNDHAKRWTFYADGALVGTNVATLNANVDYFMFGSRSDGWESVTMSGDYKDACVYRVCLRPEQIYQLYSGRIPKAGLEAYCSLANPLDPADGTVRTLPTFGPTRNSFTITSASTITYTPRPAID